MKNIIIPLFLLVCTVLIIFIEFKQKKSQYQNIQKSSMEIENIEFSNLWSVRLDENTSYDTLWNVTPKKQNNLVKKVESNVSTLISTEKKTICVEKSCYRLLATIQNSSKKRVLFYNEKLKPKIQEYSLYHTLEKKVKIIAIDNYSVAFREINSSKVWRLKMFDINITKYKPKEIE